MKIVAGILCAGLCCLQATATGLSDANIPSEDEICEALVTGEIDYEQYQLLLEAAQYGIDLDLLDAGDLLADSLFPSGSSADSETAMDRSAKNSRAERIRMLYRYFQEIDAPSRSRYLLGISAKPDDQWKYDLRLRRELTGRERFVSRSAKYTSDSGLVRTIELGNFTRKFGLGSAVGYRGKLLSCSDKLDSESWLYPDFAGFNGVAVDMKSGKWEFSTLASYNRSSTHALQVIATSISKKKGRVRPGLSLAINRLENRANRARLLDYKSAATLAIQTRRHQATLEYGLQIGEQKPVGTFLAEILALPDFGRVRIYGWRYGDRYLSLSSGGRSASLSHKVDLEEVDFDCSDRRAGQSGLQLHFDGALAEKTALAVNVLYAQTAVDSANLQFRNELERHIGKRWQVGAQYYANWIERGAKDSLVHRIRALLQFSGASLQVKTTFGRSIPESGEGSFAWLADLRVKVSEETRLQFWSNLARFSVDKVDYWYLFVKVEQEIAGSIRIATKFAERYLASSANRHQLSLALEVSGSL
jgi:hypothetical protein